MQLGVRISEAALQGWESPEMEAVLAKMAAFVDLSPEEALQQVLASTDEAVKVASTFGASKLCRLCLLYTSPVQRSCRR